MDDQFIAKVQQLAAVGRAQELQFDGVVARVAVDQFCRIVKPTNVETERFVYVMSNALPKTDPEQAARIAEILAPRPALPEIVFALLVERGAAAAAIVMRQAPHLSTTFLLARAVAGDGAEALAIAGRRDLDRPVVAALAQRPEPEVLRAIVQNASADVEHGALPALIQRGRVDRALARALLRRAGLGLRALPLFLAADPDTRRDLIVEAQREALTTPGHPTSSLQAIQVSVLSAANAGNAKGFARTIALGLKTSRAAIDSMIEDSGGEPLALLFAATAANPAAAAEAIAMLRPAAPVHGNPNVRLALEMRPTAALRIVCAITNGRVATSGQAPAGASPQRRDGWLSASPGISVHRTIRQNVNRA